MRKLRPSLSLVSPLRSSLTACLPLTAVLVATPVWAQEDPAADPAADTAVAPAAEPAPVEDVPAPGEAAPPAQPAPPPAEGKSEAKPSATVAAGGGGVVQMGDSGKAGGPAGGSHVQTMGGGLGSALAGGPVPDSDDEWKFDYHGYMRAPMRIGVGERANAKTNQSVTTLSVPQIPTDQYIDWQYTQSAPRSTAEMFFSYGNSIVRGVTSIQAFRLSDSTFIDPTLQSGVTLAWVEVTPDLSDIVEDLRMNAKVGSFWSRYGGAGQYDAGAYETFVIGRTHTIGENIRLEYDYNDFVWFFEEGFGTKQPDPSPFHNIKYTLIGHVHAGFNWDQFLDVGLHYMHAWTQEQDHECISSSDEELQNNPAGDDSARVLFARFAEAPVGACKQDTVQVPTDTYDQLRADSPDGSLQVLGADFVFNTSMAGRLFVGASHIIAKHAVTVAPAIEVIHAFGGGFFKSGVTHQFLNERENWDRAYDPTQGRDGNGTISTLSMQWDLSIASLIELPQQLDLTAFGMLNLIKSEDDKALENISKLKYGADLVWGPLSWFAAGFRFDRLQPRSDIPEQNFTVLAPRLIFRSDFATHEEISIGYARYLYAQRECTNYQAAQGAAASDWSDLRKCVQPPNATIAPEGFANRPGVTASKEQRGGPIDIESVRGGFPDNGWTAPHEHVFYVSADIWW